MAKGGGITEALLEEIKARTDLADLIASYGVQVQRAGASMKACCPFHHEKTPSFNINVSKGFYHCFGCGESGDAIKFVQKMEGLSFVDAVKKLGEQCGLKVEEKEDPDAERRKRLLALLAELAQFYHRCLRQTKAAEIARDYLAKRDLSEQVQDDWLVGYAPDGAATMLKWADKYGYTAAELEAAGVILAPKDARDRGYHRFGGRLMFSIRDRRGRVVGFSGRQLVENKRSGKYVNSPETLVFKKSNVLFGFDRAAGAIVKAPHREVIVCEGQIDCIRLHACGFANSVAGQGTAFTEEHVKMLKKAADQVALVYDDDGAGHKATIRSARLCLAAELPVRVVSLPDGDDPDSFLRRHPAADFQKLLDGAASIMAFQVRAERAKEAHPDTVDAVNRITRELIATIAQCPNRVIRSSMTGEAAGLLKLPAAALDEELERELARARAAAMRPRMAASKPEPEPSPDDAEAESAFDGYDGEDAGATFEGEEPIEGELASAVVPPSATEAAFVAFLMANEYDKTLDGMIGEFLPSAVFEHDFTRRFVDAWRSEAAKGEDMMGAFADGLSGQERGWFDAAMSSGKKTMPSGLSATDILEDFVRTLWCERLKRERGNLPATGDAEAEMRRMKLSLDLKRFKQLRWNKVKDLVRDYLGTPAS